MVFSCYDTVVIYIALLRAVNVGGRNLLSMSELTSLFNSLGFHGARTMLQSGNVVFSCAGGSAASLERRLERETRNHFKIPVEYFVHTLPQWRTIVDRNPFSREAKSDPGHLIVVVLKKAATPKAAAILAAALRGPERIRVEGKTAYIIYPEGQGRSKLTPAVIERALGSKGTARNWNTVLKLLTLASSTAG